MKVKVVAGKNDLLTLYPTVVEEWSYEKNGDIMPSSIYPGTHTKYWWKCKTCGHEWETAVRDRVKGRNCPECAIKQRTISTYKTKLSTNKSLAIVRPDLAMEWNYERNNPQTPEMVTPSSGQRVWWKCSICGNEWEARVCTRYNGNRCPSCRAIYHVSYPEKALFYYLKKSFPDTIDNIRFDWLKGQELDIYIPSLSIAIEYDGDHWHQDTKRDNQKGLLLKEHGIILFRVREPKCPPIDDGSMVIHISKIEKNYSHMNEAINMLYEELKSITEHVIIPDVDVLRDNIQILGTYQKFKEDNSLQSSFPDLAKEWDYEKNGKLKPNMITPGNDAKVWWRCAKCGNEWKAAIGSRTRGIGCPACGVRKRIVSAHKIRVEKKDKILAYTNPELLEDWDYIKNRALGIEPTELSRGSTTKVWWKCHACGNEWEASANMRTNKNHNTGCPRCSKEIARKKLIRKNLNSEKDSLAVALPALSEEWDYERNDDSPYDYSANSGYKVWWICKKCGFSWQAQISNRANGSGCPECHRKSYTRNGGNTIRYVKPDLLNEWDYEKNEELNLDVDSIPLGSDKKVWWRCTTCGYSWMATIHNRAVKHTGCPMCSKAKCGHPKRAVVCLENEIEYESVKDAAISTHCGECSIRKCCQGKKETAGGLHWKYKDECR